MSVLVTLCSRLGNNLFQYALGRIIAEHHGLAFTCIQEPLADLSVGGVRVRRDSSCTLTALGDHFVNAPLRLDGRSVERPIQRFELPSKGGWTGHRIDLQSVLDDSTPRSIRLRGYFQRSQYYARHRDRIRQWFTLRGATPLPTVHPSDVVVNVRRGADFGFLHRGLSMDYYDRALARVGDAGRVFVCGLGIDATVRDRLARYRPIYYDASPIEHFRFIMQFNRIVLSNSTFAWWAAFLSDASEILGPRSTDPRLHAFTGHPDVDLHMDGGRYIEVDAGGNSEFGVLIPGPAMLGRLDGCCAADVTRAEIDDRFGELDEEARRLLCYVLAEYGSATLTCLQRRWPSVETARAFGSLLARRFVAIDPTYLP